jgi:hypothetical protein
VTRRTAFLLSGLVASLGVVDDFLGEYEEVCRQRVKLKDVVSPPSDLIRRPPFEALDLDPYIPEFQRRRR